MNSSSEPQSLVVADRPFFTEREDLDDQLSMSSVNFAKGDLSVGRYRRDRPGHGVSPPNPAANMIMAVVILRPRPAHVGWRNGRTVEIPALETGSLSCLDLRESWSMDLSDPFDSLHAFIPMAAFDEITAELKLPKVEQLAGSSLIQTYDETMLGLARTLNPALAKPSEATALFTDHVFSAMVAHLAVRYGGLNYADIHTGNAGPGTLTTLQRSRVTSRLLDDLKDDPGLAELAALCGLSRSHFARAFRRTIGLPPHQWLLMQRLNRARALLVSSEIPISLIAFDCGFADQSHLTRAFTRMMGIGPGALRRQLRD